MKINFTKMHGCGNDYIYVNCLDGVLPEPEKIAKEMSPRRFSVGADGLILICPSAVADAKMRIFNLDGSEGKMCGNGIRCVGKFLYDGKITSKTELDIETLSGIKHLSLALRNGKVETVDVDMGRATLRASEIPVAAKTETVVGAPLFVCGEEYGITCVSMGNPHAVTFVSNLERLNLEKIGPFFENNEIFPERVNTEFVEIAGKNVLKMRVWERGSGETLACGTGACAAAVAAIIGGYCDYGAPIKVSLLGGELEITVNEDLRVFMSGEAKTVYQGVYEYEC